MRKIVMTQEMIDDFKQRHEHRPEKWRSQFVCKLCLPLWRASKQGLAEYWQPLPRRYFKAGQEVYEVTYPNGQVGYYHVLCLDTLGELWENKKIRDKYVFYFLELEQILRYDVDRWNGLDVFIKGLVDKKHAQKQIIQEIATRFDCSYTTGWRKLRAFKSNPT